MTSIISNPLLNTKILRAPDFTIVLEHSQKLFQTSRRGFMLLRRDNCISAVFFADLALLPLYLSAPSPNTVQ